MAGLNDKHNYRAFRGAVNITAVELEAWLETGGNPARRLDESESVGRAGVRMAYGTDAGVMPHGLAGHQFRWMVEYGMTPMEAIQSATRNAAQALNREADVGAIAVGRYADIVAVNGDPLADVRQLESVDVVIKGGVLVSDLRAAHPPSQTP